MTETKVRPVFTLAEAADYLRYSERTTEQLIRDGRLKAKRTSLDAHGNPAGPYRIRLAALEDFIEGLPDA